MDVTAFEHDGLILAREILPLVASHRALVRAVEIGELVRLRRGSYVRSEVWSALSARQQHLLRVRAVMADAHGDVVVAGPSAAAVWGMPVEHFPLEVTLLDRWRGGGRSDPGVRRTSRGAQSASLDVHDGVRCTDVARTAVDVARGRPFPVAVGILDWALWRKNPLAVDREALAAAAEQVRPSRVLRAAIAFATHLSDSVGESEARCVIHQLGLPAPALQRPFVDADGRIEPDFTWEEFGVAAEFDGKMKYTRSQYTQGDPAEVVWREKKREDRLRRQVRTVVRIVTDDVRRPARLRALLTDAGVASTRRGGS